MKEIVEFIVKELVEDKEAVKVVEENDGNLNILKVTVANSDLGRVIGKNGKIANSIRTIVKTLAIKNKTKYLVKIGEK